MAIRIEIGTVELVEGKKTKDGFDALRVKAKLREDNTNDTKDIPWATPLMPKMVHVLPKKGEGVLVFIEEQNGSPINSGVRYFLGPIISQPQYMEDSPRVCGTSTYMSRILNPIERLSNNTDTTGAFPEEEDVALIGRGKEDIILRYNNKVSEVDIRAGIKSATTNDQDPNIFGNIIFNGVDPAYIQLKFKNGIASERGHEANSVINMVANRINIMSNLDADVKGNLNDNKTLIPEDKMDTVMNNLHPLPKGDRLVELLEIMKGAILYHVHPWAGMEQCGDWQNYINRLKDFIPETILSEYVRIS